jgi:S-DNA-T family DNA segregation ATPase FtsK/SpoIIIE
LPGTSTLLRGQGTYLSDDEISNVVDFVATDNPQFAGELMQLKTKDELESAGSGEFKNRDELYETAVDIVVRERRGSCSLLQRALGIGYGRAARLIDFMAEDGIVGQYNGSQARDVMISLEDWEARSSAECDTINSEVAAGAGQSAAPAKAPTIRTIRPTAEIETAATVTQRRRNKIVPDPDDPSELEDELIDDEGYEEEEVGENDHDDEEVAANEEVEDDEYDEEVDAEESEEEETDAEEDDVDESDEEYEEEEEDEDDSESDDEEWEEEESDELADDEEWEEEEEDELDEGEDEWDDEEEEIEVDEEPPVKNPVKRPASMKSRRHGQRA